MWDTTKLHTCIYKATVTSSSCHHDCREDHFMLHAAASLLAWNTTTAVPVIRSDDLILWSCINLCAIVPRWICFFAWWDSVSHNCCPSTRADVDGTMNTQCARKNEQKVVYPVTSTTPRWGWNVHWTLEKVPDLTYSIMKLHLMVCLYHIFYHGVGNQYLRNVTQRSE